MYGRISDIPAMRIMTQSVDPNESNQDISFGFKFVKPTSLP